MCPCFGKKPSGTADSQYTATPPSTAGTRPSTAEDHSVGFKNMFFGAVKSDHGLSVKRERHGREDGPGDGQVDSTPPPGFRTPRRRPPSSASASRVVGFAVVTKQAEARENMHYHIRSAPAPAPTSPGKKKKQKKQGLATTAACKCPKGVGGVAMRRS